MNTGQMILTIGAMILLSAIILRVNNNFLSTNEVMDESKFGVLAVSLATSIIEEANNKSFDQVTKGNPIDDPNLLTPVNSLGPDGGEIYETYNDFDDFNGYTKDVTNLPSATFHISCKVNYINPVAPDIVSTNRTWNKKITVSVSSPFSKDTVQLSSVFSYWYFR